MTLARSREQQINQATEWIKEADALLIGAGAGMGVDSGLPDFRGNDGFWKAYPALKNQNKSFSDMANPMWFELNPRKAWGFYGHRLNLYRSTQPHEGFNILKAWADTCPNGAMVFTSNVDGQFQKAGFREQDIVECHGSIHHLQCSKSCSYDIWPADDLELEIDETTLTLTNSIPRCPDCGEVARPNILMFNDGYWNSDRTDEQEDIFYQWASQAGNILAIEIGAGTAIPSVRYKTTEIGHKIIRINPRQSVISKRFTGISLEMGGLEALKSINQAM
jgi:NAD-dependent SIR2 family protein deacetylase